MRSWSWAEEAPSVDLSQAPPASFWRPLSVSLRGMLSGSGRWVAVVAAALIGVVAAYGAHALKGSGTALQTNSSPSPGAASPSPVPTATPRPSPSAAPTPTSVPSPYPSSPVTAHGGPAPYPSELNAGSSYAYNGKGTETAFARDSLDVAGTACAGINESTTAVPPGYETYFFVSFNFPDGKIISAGYIKDSAGRGDFASIQNKDGTGRQGVSSPAGSLASGSHTYCVTHSA